MMASMVSFYWREREGEGEREREKREREREGSEDPSGGKQ